MTTTKTNAIAIVTEMAKLLDPKNAQYILGDYWISDKIDDLQRAIDREDEWATNHYTKRISEMVAEFNDMRLCPSNVEVGDGVTQNLWSDRKAFTIIKKTAQSITVQRDKATRAFTPEFVQGGFAANCTNNDDQVYTYEADPEGEIVVYRWSKKENIYKNKYSSLSKGRKEKYDYNF